jgi:glycosyl hydrolase family 42 (putative beta-galactosidase)
MNKIYILLVFLCLFIGQLNAEIIKDFNFSSSENMRKFKVYPGSRKNLQKQVSNCLVLTRPDDKGYLGTYTIFSLPSDINQIAVTLVYKLIVPGSSKGEITLLMKYADKSKRNGSVGTQRASIEPTKSWKRKTILFDNVPKKAIRSQLVLTTKGGACTLHLKSVRVNSLSDETQVKKTSTAISLKSSPSGKNWSKIALLQGFTEMESARTASVQTDVKLTYDSKNLYVAYIAYEPEMASINAMVKERDGDIWKDDCIELFIFDPKKHRGWQFMVNSLGTQTDYVLRRQNPGDPYTADKSWNGKWKALTFKKKNSWETVISIPWATIGFKGVNAGELMLNFARERKVIPENSHWNVYQGKFNEVNKHARMVFKPGKATITRYRQKSNVQYAIKRPKINLNKFLTDKPGNYITGCWGGGVWPSSYPKGMQTKNSKEDFKEWRRNLFTAFGEAGMFGPRLLVAQMTNDTPMLHELYKKYGMKSPCYISSYAIAMIAKYCGAKYYLISKKNKRYDTASPGYLRAYLKRIANLKNPTIPAFTKKFKDQDFMKNIDLLLFWQGADEPTNVVTSVYKRSNKCLAEGAWEAADNQVKEKTGFGKYGLPNRGGKDDKDTPFRRIAFWRWWNSNYAHMLKLSGKAMKAIKDVPHLGINVNTTGGMHGLVDFTELTEYSDWASCDPYPTATAAYYGMDRALFHTGFSVKLTSDLAPKSRTMVMPQAFIYHGGKPSPADMREWASQGLKNGAEIFYWFTAGAPMLDMPESYREMLKLNKFIGKMNKVRLPEKTNSAILYSDYDYWALKDVPLHATYSVYSILGEQIKSWFKFISPPGVNRGLFKLNDYKVIYIPQLRYSDQKFNKSLIEYVKNGGVIVVFDPLALSYNIDGSDAVTARKELFGSTLKHKKYSGSLKYKNIDLPLSRVMNMPGPDAGLIIARDFVKLPAGAKVIAKYKDGKPAAIKHKLGKGSVIQFAAQPFGGARLAVKPGGWKKFFTNTAKQAGEKCGLPIWDFILPKPSKDSIKLNFNLKK